MLSSFSHIVYLFMIGSLAGALAGLFGIGGGLIIVPMLSWLLLAAGNQPQIMQIATATSLATMIFSSCRAVYAQHYKYRAISWQTAMIMFPGLILGAGISRNWIEHIPSSYLAIGFFICSSYMVLIMFRESTVDSGVAWNKIYLVPVAMFIAMLASLFGLGGGLFTVPILNNKFKLPIRNAIATSSLCGLMVAVSSCLVAINYTNDTAGYIGYIYLPGFIVISISSVISAPIGVKLSHTIEPKNLRKYFAWLIIISGIMLVVKIT